MVEKKKLIYADDLLTAIRDDHNINGAHFARIRRHIDAAPAVEAVPVKRCRDCEHYSEASLMCMAPVDDTHHFVEYAPPIWQPNDFCSF